MLIISLLWMLFDFVVKSIWHILGLYVGAFGRAPARVRRGHNHLIRDGTAGTAAIRRAGARPSAPTFGVDSVMGVFLRRAFIGIILLRSFIRLLTETGECGGRRYP